MSVADRVPVFQSMVLLLLLPPSTESRITKLAETLLDEDTKMFERILSVFSLRNDRSKEAVEVLCTDSQPVVHC